MFYAHGGKHDGKFFVRVLPQRGLLHDLRRKLVVGKTVAGKNRQLLSPDQSGQPIDGGNAGADIVPRVLSFYRVEGQAVYIPLQF